GKATTNEKLRAVGRSERIAAIASATVEVERIRCHAEQSPFDTLRSLRVNSAESRNLFSLIERCLDFARHDRCGFLTLTRANSKNSSRSIRLRAPSRSTLVGRLFTAGRTLEIFARIFLKICFSAISSCAVTRCIAS